MHPLNIHIYTYAHTNHQGSDRGYSQNATRAAGKLLMNSGVPGYKETGDFKVCDYMY